MMEDVTTKNVNEDSAEKQPKKCFCARCFLPIDPKDRVDVDGQNFHRMCSTCCVCHKIPKSLKMFYGHVFCEDCFKTHVLNRFKGDSSRVHSNSWWMQWAPGVKAQGPESERQPQTKPGEKPGDAKPEEDSEMKPAEGADASKCTAAEEPHKKCICARCLQAVDEKNKVEIDGQSFHPQCCKCYFCHCVPKDKVKIYYGQVFCEECFNRFIMTRNKEIPAESLRACCEQWNNGQFAESMREFMNGNGKNESGMPIVYMMQGAHPPFCRCGCGLHQHQQQCDWFQGNEPRKSVSSALNGEEIWDFSFEYQNEASDLNIRSKESATETKEAAAEKIEKLTKYLQRKDAEKCSKKWKNFIECDNTSTCSEVEQCFPWINYQDPKIERDEKCPKCLWQCGLINVNIGACL